MSTPNIIPTTNPHPTHLQPQIRPVTSSRSIDSRLALDEQNMSRLLEYYAWNVQTIVVDTTLHDLLKPLTPSEKTKRDNLLANLVLDMDKETHSIRRISAKYVDSKHEPILFYFGERIVYDQMPPPKAISVEEQYVGQTEEEIQQEIQRLRRAGFKNVKLHSDGIKYFEAPRCELYNFAAQQLASSTKLKALDKIRHPENPTMEFHQQTDSDMEISDDDNEINDDAYVQEVSEKAGLLHLVHGWIQQAQPEKGLYISQDITRSSTTMAAAGSYYTFTSPIAKQIGLSLKVCFPEWHEKYANAFAAGAWLPNDPGPFLGRAIVYKLQGRLHHDRHDMGPSASFGVGNYTGGNMIVPQLKAKFRYGPGEMTIFYSSFIYHKVATFTAKPQTPAQQSQNILPGRIGTVFFFPKESFNILQDKPKGWGYATAFGKNEELWNLFNAQ